jgi:hypothetical protein
MKSTSIILSIFILLTLLACESRFSANPIDLKVIDAATKEPVEGALIFAHWQVEHGTIGGRGIPRQEKLLEAITDNAGKAHFPGWGPSVVLDGEIQEKRPRILIFKSGYKWRALINEMDLRKRPSNLGESDWNNKSIELTKESPRIEDSIRDFDNLSISLRGIVSSATPACVIKQMLKTLQFQEEWRNQIIRSEEFQKLLQSSNYMYRYQTGALLAKSEYSRLVTADPKSLTGTCD